MERVIIVQGKEAVNNAFENWLRLPYTKGFLFLKIPGSCFLLLNGCIANVLHHMKANSYGCYRCFCAKEEVTAHIIDGERTEQTSAVLDTPCPYVAGVSLNAICDHVCIQIIVAETVRHIMFDNTIDHQTAKLVECQAAVESMEIPSRFRKTVC